MGQTPLQHPNTDPRWGGGFPVSPVSPTLKGTPPQLHLALRDLNDAQLRQVMEDLQQETARKEGAAPPIGSPLGWWWVPVGGVDADLDDGEVTLQMGGDGDLVS